jgi:hypothetical protein
MLKGAASDCDFQLMAWRSRVSQTIRFNLYVFFDDSFDEIDLA